MCEELAQAAEDAEAGGFEAVLEWLDEGNDVNDVDDDGKSLILLTANHGDMTPRHVALARELIARGADVNRRSQSGMSPFETAVLGSHRTSLNTGPERDYVLLLIDAGLTLKEQDQHDPLAWTCWKFADAPSRPALQVLTALLRAGASLDAVTSEAEEAFGRPVAVSRRDEGEHDRAALPIASVRHSRAEARRRLGHLRNPVLARAGAAS